MKLPSIQTDQQNYFLFQFDQAPQLAEHLGLDLTVQTNVDLIKDLYTLISQEIKSEISGMVVDSIYSLDLATNKAKSAGLLSRLTTLNTEVDPLAVPTLIPDWSIEDIRSNYGLAKIELYYHPREKKALKKKQLLAELFDYCQYQQIHLLLELIVYTPAEVEFSEQIFQRDQLHAVQELRDRADILALQYPLSPLATATITAELDAPWILTNRGQQYDDLKKILRICLENGGKGALVGQSLWKDFGKLKNEDKSPDVEAIKEFIKTELSDRAIELSRIIDEISQN
ncbi:MAG: hypothetical protein U9O78_00755 [Patescibacteria group bacterium]|nr:hypothetical protein [Patescibacteria group bacterium]